MIKKYLQPITISVQLETSMATMQSVSSNTGIQGVLEDYILESGKIK